MVSPFAALPIYFGLTLAVLVYVGIVVGIVVWRHGTVIIVLMQLLKHLYRVIWGNNRFFNVWFLRSGTAITCLALLVACDWSKKMNSITEITMEFQADNWSKVPNVFVVNCNDRNDRLSYIKEYTREILKLPDDKLSILRVNCSGHKGYCGLFNSWSQVAGEIVTNKHEYALILEDDVVFKSEFPLALEIASKFMKDMDTQSIILNLGGAPYYFNESYEYSSKKADFMLSKTHYKIKQGMFAFAEAMIWNLDMAKYYLASNIWKSKRCETTMQDAYLNIDYNDNIYQMFPPVAFQNPNVSWISSNTKWTTEYGFEFINNWQVYVTATFDFLITRETIGETSSVPSTLLRWIGFSEGTLKEIAKYFL